MQRYFTDIRQAHVGQEVALSKEDSRHLLRVMRAQVGDQVWLVTGDQQTYRAELATTQDHVALLRLLEASQGPEVELPVEVTIACGLSKHDKLDYIVQKATECGMHRFIPLALHRDVVKWDQKKMGQRIERLQKIAKEAAEQSHRRIIPEVHRQLSLSDLLKHAEDYDVCLVAYEEVVKQGADRQLSQTIQAVKAGAGTKLLVVFGSEGGLTEAEVAQLQDAGFQPVGLGPRILRAETAPIYLLASLSYALELES